MYCDSVRVAADICVPIVCVMTLLCAQACCSTMKGTLALFSVC